MIPDQHRAPTPATLATAHLTLSDHDLARIYLASGKVSLLLTSWPDGTGELAWRLGHDATAMRWSAPVPLQVAP